MEQISDCILFQDNQVIILNKPAGMPVQEDRTGDPSLLRLAMAYCKHDLYLVNRIDRPCSGIVIMAKNPKAAAFLSEQYKMRNISKTYLAVVDKQVMPPSGVLEHTLVRMKRGSKVMVHPGTSGQGSIVRLKYHVLTESDTFALLALQTHSGRQHQIRAQLAAVNHPVRGDQKYGYKRGNPDRSIQLHAWKVTFQHPTKQMELSIQCPPPDHRIWNIFNIAQLTADEG